MKTSLKAIIVLALCSFTFLSYSATIQVSAPNNLYNFVNTMNDGDIIELTTSGGNYLWTGQVTVSVEKAITIRAKSSLAVRPIVAFSGTTGSFIRYNSTSASWTSKKWTFEGIEFDGFNAASSYYANGFFVQNITNLAYGINVEVKNCVFKNIGARTFTYQGGGAPSNATTAQGGDITIRDSEFRNIFQGVLAANSTLTYNPDNMTFWNCLFVGPGINGNNIRFIETSRPEYNSYQIDHCTFVNSNQRELYLPNTQSTSYIRNSLFVNGYNINSTNNYNVQIGADCGIYYTAPGGNRTTIYPFSTAARLTNPVLDNATGIATATTYRTGTTDGLPTGFFGNQIRCTETELSDLSYTGGAGPSATKTFNVSATRLINNISIAAPTNFEISLSASSGFTSSPIVLTQTAGNVNSTTIYVRLKAGLSSNLYTGNLQITSVGAASRTVNLSGTVVSGPTIFTSISSLIGFSYTAGTGPSNQLSFVINAASLTNNLIVSAPTDYEISLNSGASFVGGSSLNIAQIGGKVNNLNVFVRLKSGLAQGSYTGNLSITSTGATSKSVAVSGLIQAAPVVLTVSKTALINFTYSNGNGPSAIQSFTVNGSGLTSNIKITAPANYEISFFTGTSFSGASTLSIAPVNGNVSLTNIYLRMKRDLAVGTYTAKATIETTGATTKEINLSGFVTEATGITVTATTLNGFEYIVGNGPSAEKSFDMTGVNLTTYVLVTAPANYEVSTSSGFAFSGAGQMMLDQASVNGQTLRIYVRLIGGLNAGGYNGNLTVSSSGAATKSISIVGNVYNSTVVIREPAVYPTRFSNYTLTNKWMFSKYTSNYSLGNELVAASNMARGMTVWNGKMIFADRGNKQIVVVNGQTGLKETAIPLNPSMFTYIGRNVANTADSTFIAGTYMHNDIKIDNAGNVLIANLITANTQRYQIYKIDMATGNGTLVIDQSNLANLFPLAITMRFDAFGVWGDVNSDAVIYAANSAASSMEVYKWTISGGIVSVPSVIRLDNTTIGTYFTGIESLGGNAHIYPISADNFYVDGGGTYPTLVNSSGAVLDGFYRQSSALKDSVTAPGQSWYMNTGNNGMAQFTMGGNHFLVTSATNTTGIPASAFRLFKFSDNTKSFVNLDCMWTFPQAGMGVTANGYRTAIPMVTVSGYTAKIYVYCGENGFGMYELNMNPLSTEVDENQLTNNKISVINQEFRINEPAQRFEVYNITGQLLLSAVNVSKLKAPSTKGVYIVKVIDKAGESYSQKVIMK